jgi:hypothetical protein
VQVAAFPLDAHPDIAVTTRRTLARQARDLVLRTPLPSRYLLRRADGLSPVQNGGPAPGEDDDDDDFIVEYLSTFLQTCTFLGNTVRSVVMTNERRHAGKVHGGDDAVAPRPGRGVAATGAKVEYVRVGGTEKYQAVRNTHDPSSSKRTCA